MEKKQFKAESKRLMDLMINSIYTNKEICLRELISNASDAIDKLAYRALTDDKVGLNRSEFKIWIRADKDARTVTISDNGIGMTAEELEHNLGTIASSGSLQFRKDVAAEQGTDEKDVDIIGQFGVGFYSAFMVAEKINVISRAYGTDQTYEWESSGVDGYTVEPCQQREIVGTDIILHIKEDTEEESYRNYMDPYFIKNMVKKYSDYIRYPIEVLFTKTKAKEKAPDAPEDEPAGFEEYTEWEVVNSQIPLWQRPKDEVTDEEYDTFYRSKFADMDAPLTTIRVSAEGNITYEALMYIPSAAPQNFYSREAERGLQLYSSGVLIMDKCADLLPEYYRFVQGIVDTPDVSLNISREMLQQTRVLQIISRNLEKKIKNELLRLQKDDREKYEQFWANFGPQVKYGIVNAGGSRTLPELLLFASSEKPEGTTLQEYIDRMPEEQKYLYFASGKETDQLKKLPQAERILDKGYEILYMTDDLDEFVVQTIAGVKDKPFKSVNDEDALPETEEEKKEIEAKAEANAFVVDFVKEQLGDKVNDVRISRILKSQPVCMVSDGAITLEMEKYFSKLGRGAMGFTANRILELNPDSKTFKALKNAILDDEDKARRYVNLLYNQSLIIADLPLEDPAGFAADICELMV
jgi:molecular chaperone HtpG